MLKQTASDKYMVKRYLANNVITAKSVYPLSVVSVEDGCLKSILPFEYETPNTEYVPGIIVVADRKDCKMLDRTLVDLIKKNAVVTIAMITGLLSQEAESGNEVVLYAVDMAAHMVRTLN